MRKNIRYQPAPNKGSRVHPAQSSSTNPDTQKPIFSLEHMVNGFCIDSCEKNEKAAFADAIFKRSKLSWMQLRSAPKHGLGYEKIKKLNVEIPKHISEDVNIIAFRCDGTKPMVGYRDGRIFYILWIDRDFKVYDH